MQLMIPKDAGRLTGWTPAQIDLMCRNGLAKYYRLRGRIVVDVSKLYELKIKAMKQEARAQAKARAIAQAKAAAEAKAKRKIARPFGRRMR